jgi:Holliday junction DNA helicase RuvA
MIYSISGTLVQQGNGYLVVDTGPVAFKVRVSAGVLTRVASSRSVTLFTYLHVKEDVLELYGFLDEYELLVFEQLTSVSGIGPRSALGILGVASIEQLAAAINAGRAELLTRVAGIGKKTAERITLELKGRLPAVPGARAISSMESDIELEETLVSLGYTRHQARNAVSALDPKIAQFKDRLREVLKRLKE